MSEFEQFGPAWSGNRCCGKPVGCTNVGDGCRMRNHRWKQRNVLHATASAEPTAPEGADNDA